MYDPLIFVAGPSGSGKSTSLRNLDPEKTIIINTENEPLPFPDGYKFKKMVKVKNLANFRTALKKALESTEADVIIIDSFTSLVEFLYRAVVGSADKTGDGSFAAWEQYKEKILQILLQCKDTGKIIVFLGLDETILDEKRRRFKTVMVQGSLKGLIQKEFGVMLWAKVLSMDAVEHKHERYVFVTNSDGVCEAKTPMDMFDDLHIPNCLNTVIQEVKKYHKGEK